MKVTICQQKDEWNKWFNNQDKAQFLQSWEWGEFKRSIGKDVLRLQLKDNNEVVNQIQGVRHELAPGFSYFYFPRISTGHFEKFSHFLADRSGIFARIEPVDKRIKNNIQFEESHNRQPENTILLDVTESEEDLLEDMHSKTRYNIRLSDRKGVETKKEKNLNIFWKLHQETIQRADFSGHDKKYYENMLDLENFYQLTSYYEDQPLASNILVRFQDTLTYLHGASSREHRDVMATYKTQWGGIKLAKELGCKYYDFWGIAPIVDEEYENTEKSFGYHWPADHDLSGVTRFKVRFSGEVVTYPQAQDVVFNDFKYKLYKLAKKIL